MVITFLLRGVFLIGSAQSLEVPAIGLRSGMCVYAHGIDKKMNIFCTYLAVKIATLGFGFIGENREVNPTLTKWAKSAFSCPHFAAIAFYQKDKARRR